MTPSAGKGQAKRTSVRLRVGNRPVRMSLLAPPEFRRAIIVANGAGAPMEHEFITYFHERLAEKGFLTVKFNFPYQEEKRSSPDRSAILEDTYLAVIDHLVEKCGLKVSQIVGGGKSMGGRIASMVAARAGLSRLCFLGYPLHPSGQPDRLRDKHLYELKAKLLFLAGTRDPLCRLDLLRPVLGRLKRAQLVEIPDGDHSFRVTKRSGQNQTEVHESMVAGIVRFAR